MFFCRYDVDGNVLLDRHETNKVLTELGEKKNPESRPGIGSMLRPSSHTIFSLTIKDKSFDSKVFLKAACCT